MSLTTFGEFGYSTVKIGNKLYLKQVCVLSFAWESKTSMLSRGKPDLGPSTGAPVEIEKIKTDDFRDDKIYKICKTPLTSSVSLGDESPSNSKN